MYFILFVLFILSACQPSPTGQGQAATAEQVNTPPPPPTASPSPTQTPEGLKLIFNSQFPEYNTDFTKYSIVNLNNFISGEVLSQERKYVETNNIFTSEVTPPTEISTMEDRLYSQNNNFSVTAKTILVQNSTRGLYTDNANVRPIKIISFYPFFDLDLFDKMGLDEAIEYNETTKKLGLSKEYYIQSQKTRFWIVSWAYANPDNTVTIGHTFINRNIYSSDQEAAKKNQRDLKFMPGFKHTKITYVGNPFDDFTNGWVFLDRLWKIYPDLKPDENLASEWIKTRQMPGELGGDLFTYQTSITYW